MTTAFDMKSGLFLVVVTGLAAVALRALGLAPWADLTAVAYLASATLTWGRPVWAPAPPPTPARGHPGGRDQKKKPV